MANLSALCRAGETLVVKRVSITQPVQDKIEGIFKAQAAALLDGNDEEIQFGSDWKPDADEILVMDLPAEAQAVLQALDGSVISLPTINASNFTAESIKALCVPIESGGSRRLLIQLFTS